MMIIFFKDSSAL